MDEMRDRLEGNNLNLEKHRLRHSSPTHCCFSITMKCPLSCRTCYIWKQKENLFNELPVKKWIDTTRHLPELLDKNIDIIVTGGEPLLKEGILDLISFCSRIGYKISLQTNAFLIDAELAKKLADASLWRACISLYSLKPEIHDFLRGRHGVYKRALKAIDYLAKFAPDVGINIQAMIMDINLEEMVAMAEWVERDERLDYILYLAPVLPFGAINDEFWYKEDKYKFMWPQDATRVNSILDELIDKKNYFKKIVNSIPQLRIFKRYFNQPFVSSDTKCTLGLRDVNIDAQGNVYLCFLKPAIGNIQENNLKDIWMSKEAKETRLQMNHCKKKCHFLINCSFSESDFIF